MFDFMSAGEAFTALKEKRGILIDVRSREDYDKGHLPGAEQISLSEILNGTYRNNSFFQSTQADPKDQSVILYCATGVSSLQAAVRLSEDGYESYSISGGLADYRGQLITNPDR